MFHSTGRHAFLTAGLAAELALQGLTVLQSVFQRIGGDLGLALQNGVLGDRIARAALRSGNPYSTTSSKRRASASSRISTWIVAARTRLSVLFGSSMKASTEFSTRRISPTSF